MGDWRLNIYVEEHGAKKEITRFIDFSDRTAAVVAVEKREEEYASRGPDDLIVVDSGLERVSFLKRDFRSTKIMSLTF
jgi:hypothetical protein